MRTKVSSRCFDLIYMVPAKRVKSTQTAAGVF